MENAFINARWPRARGLIFLAISALAFALAWGAAPPSTALARPDAAMENAPTQATTPQGTLKTV